MVIRLTSSQLLMKSASIAVLMAFASGAYAMGTYVKSGSGETLMTPYGECVQNVDGTAGICGEPAPVDSDGDGVTDDMDKCPGTAAGVKVDASGCPLDSDGDGVVDSKDKCPDTPKGAAVDANGCPLDSDGDGDLTVSVEPHVPDDEDDVAGDEPEPVELEADLVVLAAAQTPASGSREGSAAPAPSCTSASTTELGSPGPWRSWRPDTTYRARSHSRSSWPARSAAVRAAWSRWRHRRDRR